MGRSPYLNHRSLSRHLSSTRPTIKEWSENSKEFINSFFEFKTLSLFLNLKLTLLLTISTLIYVFCICIYKFLCTCVYVNTYVYEQYKLEV